MGSSPTKEEAPSLAAIGALQNSATEIIPDYTHAGKNRNWTQRKLSSLRVSEALKNSEWPVQQKHGENIHYCGTQLEFLEKIDGGLLLHAANFCKQRMCPMCMWRKSLKTFAQTQSLMSRLSDRNYRYVFLTLTLKNCEDFEVPDMISDLNAGATRLFRKKQVSGIVQGYIKNLELTVNLDRHSKSFMTFHPHIHLIIAVKPSYFGKDKNYYLRQKDWERLWKESARVDYDPIVHIETVTKSEQEKAVAELAKYPIKFDQKLNEIAYQSPLLFDWAIEQLDMHLAGRRLTEYYGCFKDVRALLKQEDVETGDLIHTDDEKPRESELTGVLYKYQWKTGGYIQID